MDINLDLRDSSRHKYRYLSTLTVKIFVDRQLKVRITILDDLR